MFAFCFKLEMALLKVIFLLLLTSLWLLCLTKLQIMNQY